jgi:hypothetical protein
MTGRRPKAAPKAQTAPRESRAEQDRRVARLSFVWTRRGAIIGAVGVVVGVAAIVMSIVLTQRGSTAPPGIAVNVVPLEQFGGAAIDPVPAGAPSGYVGSAWSFHVDCLQQVRPNYLFARISDGPYKNHWIDVFDIMTPTGGDVRFVQPPLPQCGPAVNAPATPTTSP